MENRPDLAIIAAYDQRRAIGRQGTIPWRIPSDQKLFQRLTTGAIVIMGRRTWESLPAAVRPLPNRFNMVITRRRDYRAKGAFVVDSFDHALDLTDGQFAPRFVIGGADVYRQAIPHATRLYLSEVQAAFPHTDAFMPLIDESEWAEMKADLRREVGDNHWYRFRELVRRDQLVSMDAIHHMLRHTPPTPQGGIIGDPRHA